jgi:hypothetical protein
VCVGILFVAYAIFSGTVVNRVAGAAGAQPKDPFYALWFADPSVARGLARGTPVRVVVSNQTKDAHTLRWSSSSTESTLQRGSTHVPKASTTTFVVQTRDAAVGQWFWIRLDGTSIAIKAWIGE